MRVRWVLAVLLIGMFAGSAHASMRQPGAAPLEQRGGGEANLVLPDLGQVSFLGVNARTLLTSGLGVCVLEIGRAHV